MERVEVGEIVATVHLNGLQETNCHPQPDHDQVVAEQQDANEEPSPQYCRERERERERERAISTYSRWGQDSPTVSIGWAYSATIPKGDWK